MGRHMCGLYLHEYLQGIDACKMAFELVREPQDREQEQVRALVEATYAQLLLALNRIDDAATHAAVAREMAAKSGAVRAKISAATVSGLVEVYKGNVDVGISRIVAVRDQAKVLAPSYQDALRASVNAYERAGQPDRALSMNRELMMHVRNIHREAIMQQQQQHLQRLGLPDPDTASLRLIEDRDEALKQKARRRRSEAGRVPRAHGAHGRAARRRQRRTRLPGGDVGSPAGTRTRARHRKRPSASNWPLGCTTSARWSSRTR